MYSASIVMIKIKSKVANRKRDSPIIRTLIVKIANLLRKLQNSKYIKLVKYLFSIP